MERTVAEKADRCGPSSGPDTARLCVRGGPCPPGILEVVGCADDALLMDTMPSADLRRVRTERFPMRDTRRPPKFIWRVLAPPGDDPCGALGTSTGECGSPVSEIWNLRTGTKGPVPMEDPAGAVPPLLALPVTRTALWLFPQALLAIEVGRRVAMGIGAVPDFREGRLEVARATRREDWWMALNWLRREKCSFMSVLSTSSITSFLSLSKSGLHKCARKLYPGCRINAQLAAK